MNENYVCKKIKKKNILLGILILILLITVGGITYAFYVVEIGGRSTSNVNIVSKTVDKLRFYTDKSAFNIVATQFNFVAGTNSLNDSITATAELTANSSNNTASYNYYVYLNIHENNYIYTTSNNTPEILMTIKKPDNTMAVAADFPDLTYSTVTGVEGIAVSGFDITGKEGLITIADNYLITSNSSTSATIQNWVITIYFMNLATDQTDNENKTLNAEIIIQKGEIFNLANYVISQPKVTTGAGLYHHDGTLPNGINDDSYRYAGASTSVKNYVCFGSNTSPCPEANLYRIIGAFKNASDNYEVKLIKADYAGQTELGAAPASSTTMPDSSYPNYNSNHGGYLTSVAKYYWSGSSSNQSNTWSESTLNTNTLNGTYLTNLTTTWTDKITTHAWKVGGNIIWKIYEKKAATAYQNEIVNPVPNPGPEATSTTGEIEYNAKVGLMYVSDYMYGTSSDKWTLVGWNNDATLDYRAAINSNWLYMGMTELTITRQADNKCSAFRVNSTGYVSNDCVLGGCSGGVRPVFYLESQTGYSSGDGTRENPIRIE